MRKTGRAKLDGSPGGSESGSMEEERSNPAKHKCYNQTTTTTKIFLFLLFIEMAIPRGGELRVELWA